MVTEDGVAESLGGNPKGKRGFSLQEPEGFFHQIYADMVLCTSDHHRSFAVWPFGTRFTGVVFIGMRAAQAL